MDLVGSTSPYSLKPWEWQRSEWTSQNIPNLSGKVALVTGANGGVGLETSFQLFRNGAHVMMGCRSEEKFDIARESILRRKYQEHQRGRQDGSLSYLHVDTSTIRLSQQAARDVLNDSQIDRLDIFVACAGRGSKVGPLNEDGVEPFMATNCLGHLALLEPLLPLMIMTSRMSSTSCRIVFVSSVAEQWSSLPWPFAITPTFLSWDNINDKRKGERILYSASKLAQILTMKRLNTELREHNISCLAIHPGELNNNFVQEMIPKPLYPYIRSVLKYLLLDEKEGARTCLYAATSKDVDDQSLRGSYVTYPTRVKSPSRLATDVTLANNLWSLQHQLVEERSQKTK
ncbi:hypothetical protein CBS101457_006281 [Exobasidium rhododendri]|nr:hypothetical protein CBS101457_006281 [Exobasidium rhododendri]